MSGEFNGRQARQAGMKNPACLAARRIGSFRRMALSLRRL